MYCFIILIVSPHIAGVAIVSREGYPDFTSMGFSFKVL